MRKLHKAIILILMMLGHNFVINQPQSLQKQIQSTHQASVTQFNLLYSIPSVFSLLLIIPAGILYQFYPNFSLLFASAIMFFGEALVAFFVPSGKDNYFTLAIAGRSLEAIGAEMLYMIQGNLASTWMSNYAGIIFILPEVGEIFNAFLTPWAAVHWGVEGSLWLGMAFCFISSVACWYLFCFLKKRQKTKIEDPEKLEMIEKMYENIKSPPSSTRVSADELPDKLKTLESSSTDIGQSTDSETDSNRAEGLSDLDGIDGEFIHHPKNVRTRSFQEKHLKEIKKQPSSILQSGKIFWLLIVLCTINESLYFPFLDNANELIQSRFKIPYEETGFFLCLPFCAASTYLLDICIVLSTMILSIVMKSSSRKKLIFYTSILSFLGHLIIFMLPNSNEAMSMLKKLLLAFGFFLFGTGIGSYYSVCFPTVGLAVPQKIRGLAYGTLCFFQTLVMSLVPTFSGMIIEEDSEDEVNGYKNSSIMFVSLALSGIVVAYIISQLANKDSFKYDDEKTCHESVSSNDKEEELELSASAKTESKF